MRHNTRPLRDRNPPPPTPILFTSVISSETATVNVVQANDSSDEEETSEKLRTPGSILKTANRPRGSYHSRDQGQIQKRGTSKKIPSPKKRNAEDTYFDREMCRFYWGAGYAQDDISGFDSAVLEHFIDVLDKLRRINKHSKGIAIVTDVQEKTVDGLRLQSFYQDLEARMRNSRKNPGLGKLVDVAQADIQCTREAIDSARTGGERWQSNSDCPTSQIRLVSKYSRETSRGH